MSKLCESEEKREKKKLFTVIGPNNQKEGEKKKLFTVIDQNNQKEEGEIKPLETVEELSIQEQDTIKRSLVRQLSNLIKNKETNQFQNQYVDNVDDFKTIKTKNKENDLDIKTPYDLSQFLINNYSFYNSGNLLYFFNDKKYVSLEKEEGESLIMELCREQVKEYGFPKILSDIYRFLEREPKLKTEKILASNDIVAFLNGCLNLKNNQFSKLSKDFFITSQLNLNFKHINDFQTPMFDNFLFSSMNGDHVLINRVWEMLGYVLTTDINEKVFFVLYGVTNSGKSVLGNVIQSFFEPQDISALTLNDLGGRFDLAGLVDKRINMSMDLVCGTVDNTAVAKLKMLTGNDICKGEQKYLPSFSFKNTAKFIFATNHKVILKNKDEAFFDRMVIIPFMNSITRERQDKFLIDKIYSERVPIALKALESYKRLVANNYIFSGGFIGFEGSQNGEEIMTDDDIIKNFIDDYCYFSADVKTFTKELYYSYYEYCTKNKFSYITDTKFSSKLNLICGNKIKKDKWRMNDDVSGKSKSLNGYIGIGLK